MRKKTTLRRNRLDRRISDDGNLDDHIVNSLISQTSINIHCLSFFFVVNAL
jgi:hypothetical protein